jgi:FKBP-type peptidyl-prolyl cis-trans isomerase
MKKLLFIAGILLSNMPVFSQPINRPKSLQSSTGDDVSTDIKTPPGYTHLPSGLDYKIIVDKKGKKTANNGDYVIMHLVRKGNGNVIFDSRALNNNQPVPYPIQNPQYAGDPIEVFKVLTKGDSVHVRIPVDSMVKAGMQPEGNYKMLDMYVNVVDVKTAKEMEDDAKKRAAKQQKIDDKLIRNYLKKNNIIATKTASGLYYKVDATGIGNTMKAGDTAQVMYVGKLINGKVFDANMGPEANRNNPLPVIVGKGKVIKGWDEGLLLMKKQGKATFYIPSSLGYGSQGTGPIPPDAIMIFDVDIRDVKEMK